MIAADVDWVVGLAAERRERIAGYAPRFWRPAPDARRAHTSFLTGLIQAPGVVGLRTDRGFVIGVPDRGRLVIDDLALEDDSLWSTDGDLLLREVASSGPVRVVCPLPEPARRAAVAELGLSVVETWWHRDLASPQHHSEAKQVHNTGPKQVLDTEATQIHDTGPKQVLDAEARVVVDGAAGSVVAAPAVYAPGGPVLLVRTLPAAPALRAIEEAASRRGCVVSVVSMQSDDQAERLVSAGYKRTTEFFG